MASASETPPPPRTLKLVLIGDGGVGKTALRSRFLTGRFSSAYRATIGADFLTKTLSYTPADGGRTPPTQVTLTVWDTAGQERFASLGTSFYRGADAVILAFDSSTAASPAKLRARLEFWYREFVDKTPIAPVDSEHARRFCWVCVGCKADLLGASRRGGRHGEEGGDKTENEELRRKVMRDVQGVLDAIMSRPELAPEALDLELPTPAPAGGSAVPPLKLDTELLADRRKSLPLPMAAASMSKRASKQSLRSTISIKPMPTPPPPDSAGSASRSRSLRAGGSSKRSSRLLSALDDAQPSALGLQEGEPGQLVRASPSRDGEGSGQDERTPTKTPPAINVPPSSDEGASTPASSSAVAFPLVGTPTSIGTTSSGSHAAATNGGGAGIYVNGHLHQRERLDSSVSQASTIYHTPRNSTFFGTSSSPAGASGRWPLPRDSASSSSGTKGRTSLESARSAFTQTSSGSGSGSGTGLRRRTSGDSVSSIRTVKGEGSSSVGHGSSSTGQEQSKGWSGDNAGKEKGKETRPPLKNLDGDGPSSSTQGMSRKTSEISSSTFETAAEVVDSEEVDEQEDRRHLTRPRLLARERSSDTVTGTSTPPRDDTDAPSTLGHGQDKERSVKDQETIPSSDSAGRPPSGLSFDTDTTERSWNQPTPRPGSWATRGEGHSRANSNNVGDAEKEHEDDDDDEEDEYGLRRSQRQGNFNLALEPIPFPSASSSAIYLEPEHGHNTLDGYSGEASSSHSKHDTSSLSRAHSRQSKKEAAQAEMERWREARSKRRRSRLSTGVSSRLDSMLSGEAAFVGGEQGEDEVGDEARGRTQSCVDGPAVPQRPSTAATRPSTSTGASSGFPAPHHDDAARSTTTPGQAQAQAPAQAQSEAEAPLDPSDPEPPTPEEGFRLFLTSSKTGEGVDAVFEHIVSRVGARWAYEAWEEREYRRGVREWRRSRRLHHHGHVAGGGRGRGKAPRWMAAVFSRRRGGRRGVSGSGEGGEETDDGEEWDVDIDEEEEERTRAAVRRAIRVAAGKEGGSGWGVKGCCSG